MKRRLICAVAVLMVTSFLNIGSAYSAVTHAGNPYRSFNSGVNYGAQYWEQNHHAHCHRTGAMVRHNR